MNPQWLTGIGTLVLAAATVGLAIVTVWSVRKTIEMNRLLMQENRALREEEASEKHKSVAIEIILSWADRAIESLDKKFPDSISSVNQLNDFMEILIELWNEGLAITRTKGHFTPRIESLLQTSVPKYLGLGVKIIKARSDILHDKTKEREYLRELKTERYDTQKLLDLLQVEVRGLQLSPRT